MNIKLLTVLHVVIVGQLVMILGIALDGSLKSDVAKYVTGLGLGMVAGSVVAVGITALHQRSHEG